MALEVKVAVMEARGNTWGAAVSGLNTLLLLGIAVYTAFFLPG